MYCVVCVVCAWFWDVCMSDVCEHVCKIVLCFLIQFMYMGEGPWGTFQHGPLSTSPSTPFLSLPPPSLALPPLPPSESPFLPLPY